MGLSMKPYYRESWVGCRKFDVVISSRISVKYTCALHQRMTSSSSGVLRHHEAIEHHHQRPAPVKILPGMVLVAEFYSQQIVNLGKNAIQNEKLLCINILDSLTQSDAFHKNIYPIKGNKKKKRNADNFLWFSVK